jgi:DNA-binding SARP family transcriptional activator
MEYKINGKLYTELAELYPHTQNIDVVIQRVQLTALDHYTEAIAFLMLRSRKIGGQWQHTDETIGIKPNFKLIKTFLDNDVTEEQLRSGIIFT